jgi:hypothetical protein
MDRIVSEDHKHGRLAQEPECEAGAEVRPPHQSQLLPAENKFHVGNGEDGKHYWLTPPAGTIRLTYHDTTYR